MDSIPTEEGFLADNASETAAPDKATKRRRLALSLAALVLSSWACCGFFAWRSCAPIAPGSVEQTAARAEAGRYLRAVGAGDIDAAFALTSQATRAAQPLEVQRRFFAEHDELFSFDAWDFTGFRYFSGSPFDRLFLAGVVSGRGVGARPFQLEMVEERPGVWRAHRFTVNVGPPRGATAASPARGGQ